MSEFEVEVVGARPRRKPGGLVWRTLKVAVRLLRAVLMRPRLLALIGAAAFVLTIGTPHVGWEYECRHSTRLGQPCRSVDYCAYYGVQGRRVAFPARGESCKLVTFLPVNWQRIVRTGR